MEEKGLDYKLGGIEDEIAPGGSSPELSARLVRNLVRLQRLSEASAALHAQLAAHPTHFELRLAALELADAQDDKVRVAVVLEELLNTKDLNVYQRAWVKLTREALMFGRLSAKDAEIVAAEPIDEDERDDIAIYLCRARQHEVARRVLARSSRPESHRHRLALVYLYAVTGRADLAEDLARQLTIEQPFDFETWVTLGSVQYRRGLHQQALTSHVRAAPLAPESPYPYIYSAPCLLKMGRRKDAASVAAIGLRKFPQSTALKVRLPVYLALSLQLFSAVRAAFGRWIPSDPGDSGLERFLD